MGPPKLISVVIAARDAADTLPTALNGLVEQDYEGPWEAIVADNGSGDGTLAAAEPLLGRLPRGRLVIAAHRRGAGAARNGGAAAAHGDLLAFCDADDRPEPGWLRGLAREAHRADLVAGALRLDALNSRLLLETAPAPPEDRPMVAFGFLPFASGGSCGVWRRPFEAVGGFDESFLTGQDIDLSWRLQLAGYRLGFAPDAVVQQRLRADAWRTVRQRLRWGQANARLYARFKHRGMRRAGLGDAAREWVGILAGAPEAAFSARRRAELLPRLGLRAGQLIGSARYGVVFP